MINVWNVITYAPRTDLIYLTPFFCTVRHPPGQGSYFNSMPLNRRIYNLVWRFSSFPAHPLYFVVVVAVAVVLDACKFKNISSCPVKCNINRMVEKPYRCQPPQFQLTVLFDLFMGKRPSRPTQYI